MDERIHQTWSFVLGVGVCPNEMDPPKTRPHAHTDTAPHQFIDARCRSCPRPPLAHFHDQVPREIHILSTLDMPKRRLFTPPVNPSRAPALAGLKRTTCFAWSLSVCRLKKEHEVLSIRENLKLLISKNTPAPLRPQQATFHIRLNFSIHPRASKSISIK